MKAIEDTPAPPTPDAILDRAGKHLIATLRPGLAGLSAPVGAGIVDGLEAVVAEVRAHLGAGSDPGATNARLPMVDARLIAALRGAVLQLPLADDAAGATVIVLRAVEAVLQRIIGPDHDSLAARLARPDALQLLVEVAHDLRSPLTSILFLSETLRTGHSGEVNVQQRSQLGLIYSAAMGLAALASNVIDLAREGRGLIDGEPELYSLSEMVQGVEEMVRPMAEEKSVELRIAVPEFEKTFGHPMATGRVLLNLTTNALRFTDEGWVEIGARRLSHTVVAFYVRDTGRGISQDRLADLFSPFKRRLGGSGHFFSGSGVGLSIARRLVRAMGAQLEVDTSMERGTCFSFELESRPLK